MAKLLSKTYLGTTAAAIQIPNGDTRIYYQGKESDGNLYQIGGVGSPASGAQYRLGQILVKSPGVRLNSPIAATAWPPESWGQIRVYYFDRNNLIHELVWNANNNFTPGALDAKKFETAPNSGFLYAINNGKGGVRVGFQAADAPEYISETEYIVGKGWTDAVKLNGTVT